MRQTVTRQESSTCSYLTVQAAEKFIGRVINGKLGHFAQKHGAHSLEEAVSPTFLANEIHKTAAAPLIGAFAALHFSNLHDALDSLDHLSDRSLHHAGVGAGREEVRIRQ